MWWKLLQKRLSAVAHSGPERSGNTVYRGELYAIYLLAAYQRQGLGQQLARAVVNGLLQHDLSSMLVWVLAAESVPRILRNVGRTAGC